MEARHNIPQETRHIQAEIKVISEPKPIPPEMRHIAQEPVNISLEIRSFGSESRNLSIDVKSERQNDRRILEKPPSLEARHPNLEMKQLPPEPKSSNLDRQSELRHMHPDIRQNHHENRIPHDPRPLHPESRPPYPEARTHVESRLPHPEPRPPHVEPRPHIESRIPHPDSRLSHQETRTPFEQSRVPPRQRSLPSSTTANLDCHPTKSTTMPKFPSEDAKGDPPYENVDLDRKIDELAIARKFNLFLLNNY